MASSFSLVLSLPRIYLLQLFLFFFFECGQLDAGLVVLSSELEDLLDFLLMELLVMIVFNIVFDIHLIDAFITKKA